MQKYNDFYDLLERFSIMTIDGRMTDADAMRQLKNATTEALFNKLDTFIKKDKKSPKNSATEPLKADIETLGKYIKAGFQLYPCYENKKDTYPYIMLNGKLKLYENEEAKANKQREGIKDLKTLKEVVLKGIVDQYGKHHKIDYFRIFPLDNNYIVIDIDKHEGKGNGFPQWRSYLKSKHLEGVETLYNLDKFPCYVTSANEGIHLYFKLPYEKPTKIHNLTENVEIKSHEGITAGGTYRSASKNKFYTLTGELENAPLLPLVIYEDMQSTEKEREAPQAKPQYKTFTNTEKYGASGNNWNNTLEGMYKKALEKNTGGKHDLIVLFCIYASHAIQDGIINTSKSEIETFLYSCPEVIQHERGTDKGDTQHIINDYIK